MTPQVLAGKPHAERRWRDDAILGVFEDPIQIPGGQDVKCPVCGAHSPPTWSFYEAPIDGSLNLEMRAGKAADVYNAVACEWMRCSNEECQQLIVRVHERRPAEVVLGGVPFIHTDIWIARPRFGEAQRPIDPLVPEPFRRDYAEAAAILDISHRMSAVLARKILGDLLKKYAKKTQNSLTAQIDGFTEEPGHPTSLTDNLHHFREVADFAAHTQETDDPEPEVIDVDRDEAEWTLDLVDRLFDYFIVQPAKDEEIRKRMDEKIDRAGRKPLRPGESDPA